MRAAHAALAVAATLSGSRIAPAEPCVPRAQVDGDAAAVAQVGGELKKLGVELGAAAGGCRTVRAQVELDREGGIAVAIVDGSHRSEGRVVGGAGVAAAWIDSWLRDDLDGIALGATASAPLSAPGLSPGLAPVRERPAAAPPSPALERLSLAAAYEHTWTEDGAGASGFGAGACLRVGRVCLGARAAYAREPDRAVNLTAMSRSDAAVLATAAVAFPVGRMSLAPELALGVGWRWTRRLECAPPTPDPGAPPPACDPADPSCAPAPPPSSCTAPAGKLYVGDGFDVSTFTPRAAATLRLSVPLSDRVWLDGLASIEVAPFGHGEAFAPGKPASGPSPGPGDFSLPGEPWRALQLGVGLRWGVP